MRICIDPGHGGRSPGAVWGVTWEKNITLAIAQKVLGLLLDAGHAVLMTRMTDKTTGLETRANLANRFKADRFVSIHVNSAATPAPSGIETLYYTGSLEGLKLARGIQTAMMSEFPDHNDRSVRERGDLTVLYRTEMPAALVEVEFGSNPKMRRLLRLDRAWRARCAAAIARGASA